uniref:Uncharacterized protein n=1 Tax=Megaselia scalaris TaxID=36166 RepID=T1GKB3_MEGSC
MESNKQECITPGGTHFSVNPPALAASGTRILEVPTTMEMNLSEDNKLLGGDPDPSKLSKKRKSYTAAEQAVMKYKNNLRKAKFYLEKSKQTELAGETPNEIQQRKNAWALDILSNEERRKNENLTYKMFCCPKSSAIEKDTSQDDILPPPCKRALYDSAASTSTSKKDPSQDDILPPPCKRALHDSSASTSASKKDPSQDDVFLPPCKRASYDSAVTISENSSSFSVYRKRGKYTKKAESTKSGKSDYASSTLTSSKSSSGDKAIESNKYELKAVMVSVEKMLQETLQNSNPLNQGNLIILLQFRRRQRLLLMRRLEQAINQR